MRRLVCTLVAGLVLAPALAGGTPKTPRVLLGAEVAERAQTSMPPRVWAHLLTSWIGKRGVVVLGRATLDDCRRANATYLIYAPFNLRPALPGSTMWHVANRLGAVSHLSITNCLTRTVEVDTVIDFASNPISTNPLETWETPVLQTLRRQQLPWLRSKRRFARGSAFAQ